MSIGNRDMNIFFETLALGADGPRVAVKDTIDIAGRPTVAGCRALRGAAPAARHAAVVDRVLAAGCRIVGKTNLHELAFGITGINDWAGTPVNPRYPKLVPGGSSSGSAAAVAAGLVDFALGTDTGGSVRIPAACCGVFGLKPTFGRVSRIGVMPQVSSLDCVGPFAASAAGLVDAMRIIDPSFGSVATGAPVIGLVEVSARREIAEAVEATVRALGRPVRRVSLPSFDQAFAASVVVINAENWAALGALVETGEVGEDVAARLRRAATIGPDDVATAELVRRAFRAEVDAALEMVDVLVLPTMPDMPPTLDGARLDRSAVGMSTLVRPFNLSGHPAATVPRTISSEGPIGLQIVGRRAEDETVLGVAQFLA